MVKSNSKIENTIEEMQTYIDNCKPQLLNNSKIIVDKEEMEELINELKANIPEEIDRYRKVISNKEAIEKEAQNKANAMVAEAAEKTNELLSEHEIMMQAKERADEIIALAVEQAQGIVDSAQMQGNAYKESAQQYLNDMLVNLHEMIYSCIDSTNKNTSKFLEALNQVGMTVQENLTELNQEEQEEPDKPEELV
ncbi:MAG TPA: hypothetical protein PLQ04_00590 [Lachnospiraceae bacterium]|nr:hypothetical protein [Lachnospiraceae bacterium]